MDNKAEVAKSFDEGGVNYDVCKQGYFIKNGINI